jgi:Zn-dependent peptidase ImmA (M78 family)
LNFKTIRQWIAFIEAIPVLEYHRVEWQADEFAGRLLIPTADLSTALNECVHDAEREGILAQGHEEVLAFCSTAMHGDFGVSRQAMETRIGKSEFWPHPALPQHSAQENFRRPRSH